MAGREHTDPKTPVRGRGNLRAFEMKLRGMFAVDDREHPLSDPEAFTAAVMEKIRARGT